MAIYLDNASTTEITPKVKEAMMTAMDMFGNPSSHHSLGYEAKKILNDAREICATSINCSPDEIFFTSGGSEGNNLIIKGIPYARLDNYKRAILTSTYEHHSVLNAIKDISRMYNNIDVHYIAPSTSGKIYKIGVSRVLQRYSPFLVTIMGANNELGTINDIYDIGEECDSWNSWYHLDAVQLYPHCDIDVREGLITSASFSGHKFHAPKGVGFLYINKENQKALRPLISGGQQEFGLRAGTENIIGITGLAKAVELYILDKSYSKKLTDLSWYFYQSMKFIPQAELNGDGMFGQDKTGIFNYRFHGIRAEQLVEFLDEHGVFVSSGSACNSDSDQPSHVLKAIELSDDEANSSVRFSLGADLGKKDIDYVMLLLRNALDIIRE